MFHLLSKANQAAADKVMVGVLIAGVVFGLAVTLIN